MLRVLENQFDVRWVLSVKYQLIFCCYSVYYELTNYQLGTNEQYISYSLEEVLWGVIKVY